MMRLKQLLGTILLAAVTTAVAASPVSQLSGVRVDGRDQSAIVTIQASGTFTHTEYRPTDNLMLVDLAGVSIAHPDTQLHGVSAPGVLSYRVVGYRYASGTEVARVELNLAPGTKASVTDIENGVEVKITGSTTAAPAPAPTPAEIKKVAAPNTVVPAMPPKSTGTSHISNVSVARGKDGVDIEITADGPMTAKTMKLSGPDRVVLDIPNSVLEGRTREIPINSNNVKDVRAARYQSAPPATRVVVDLLTARDFEVVTSAHKLVLKLKDPSSSAMKPSAGKLQEKAQIAPQQVASLTPPPRIVPQPAAASLNVTKPVAQPVDNKMADGQKAADVVFVAPIFTPKQTEAAAEKVEPTASQTRAAQAAAHFSTATPTAPATNNAPFPSRASLATNPAATNAALQQQAQVSAASSGMATNGCTGTRFTGEPINMNVKDLDLKDFFRLIHEISGLNVVLDPAVHGTLTTVLDDVPWDQAMAIVLTNYNLECQLQGNVLRIATVETLRAEAEGRHAQQDAQALAVPKQTVTRYLSYGHAKDVMPIIKKFLSPRGEVVADDRSNALIISDIPSVIPKIDDLLPLLDRKTPQVEIEARVVSATRTFARDIGTQLGFGGNNGHNTIAGVPSTSGTNDSPIKNPGGTGDLLSGNTAGTIPLFSNLAAAATSGFSFTSITSSFRLDFILSMAENRGLAKVLSRPRVVTQNNIKSIIKQGQRIPVVTASQLGGPPTVTYIEAELRLTVTPQITAENTIFLDIDVENTTPDFSKVNGTQLNPVLNTAQATTQVLVNDGGTVVIGGVIATSNSIAIAQVPLLGSIPVLGHLFKHTTVNTNTQELIFFITPKIIPT
jgi:type IV pilus assembly protein PilQ